MIGFYTEEAITLFFSVVLKVFVNRIISDVRISLKLAFRITKEITLPHLVTDIQIFSKLNNMFSFILVERQLEVHFMPICQFWLVLILATHSFLHLSQY